jgi:transcription-repair coupling factor (superfamily II helicase)
LRTAKLELVVGRPFDREAFFDFTRRTGYVQEGLADDPGELALREDVIDIYPAGAPGPMRIVLSEDDHVLELRGFDPVSQRTESFLDSVIFGPASEAILTDDVTEDLGLESDIMERMLLRLYDEMPTVFDSLGDATVLFAPGAGERVERYLDIIEDARQSRKDFGEADVLSLARSTSTASNGTGMPAACRRLY